MLVAGDQFEGATPTASELNRVVAALRQARMPVYVIPGNHDPARREYPYYWNVWRQLDESTVATILERRVIPLPGGGELLASPCMTKSRNEDPTAVVRWPPASPGTSASGWHTARLSSG